MMCHDESRQPDDRPPARTVQRPWGVLLASLVSLVHAGLTQRDAVSRAQLQWAGCGLLLGIGLMLLVFPAAGGMVTNPLLAQLMGAGFQLGFTVIGVALTIGVIGGICVVAWGRFSQVRTTSAWWRAWGALQARTVQPLTAVDPRSPVGCSG